MVTLIFIFLVFVAISLFVSTVAILSKKSLKIHFSDPNTGLDDVYTLKNFKKLLDSSEYKGKTTRSIISAINDTQKKFGSPVDDVYFSLDGTVYATSSNKHNRSYLSKSNHEAVKEINSKLNIDLTSKMKKFNEDSIHFAKNKYGPNKKAKTIISKKKSLNEADYKTLNKLLEKRNELLDDKMDGLKNKLETEIENLDINTLTDTELKYKKNLFENLPDDFDTVTNKYDQKAKQLLESETQKDIDPEQLTDEKYKTHLSAVYDLVSEDKALKENLDSNLTDALTEKMFNVDEVTNANEDAKIEQEETKKIYNAFKLTKKNLNDNTYLISENLSKRLSEIDSTIVADFKETIDLALEYKLDMDKVREKLETEVANLDILSRERLFIVRDKLKQDSELNAGRDIDDIFGNVLDKIKKEDMKSITKTVDDVVKNLKDRLDDYDDDKTIELNSAFVFCPEDVGKLSENIANKELLYSFCKAVGSNPKSFNDGISVKALKTFLNNDVKKQELTAFVQSDVYDIVNKTFNTKKNASDAIENLDASHPYVNSHLNERVDETWFKDIGEVNNIITKDPKKNILQTSQDSATPNETKDASSISLPTDQNETPLEPELKRVYDSDDFEKTSKLLDKYDDSEFDNIPPNDKSIILDTLENLPNSDIGDGVKIEILDKLKKIKQNSKTN